MSEPLIIGSLLILDVAVWAHIVTTLIEIWRLL